MASEKVHILRCASFLFVATYVKSMSHSSVFARLVSGAFCEAISPYNQSAVFVGRVVGILNVLLIRLVASSLPPRYHL